MAAGFFDILALQGLWHSTIVILTPTKEFETPGRTVNFKTPGRNIVFETPGRTIVFNTPGK